MVSIRVYFVFFFFKQKTAYEMRISDWSSDVCSSDLDSLIALMGSAQFPLRNDKSLIVASLRPSFPEHDRKSLTGSGAKRTGLKFGFDQLAGLAYKIQLTAPNHFRNA